MYVIKAASYILPIPCPKEFVHNFWVLEEARHHKIVAELHGLAISRKTGRIVPIGYKKDHSLKAYHSVICPEFASQYGFAVTAFSLRRDFTKTVYKGVDSLQKWFNAVNAIEAINSLDLNYPKGGFKIPFNSTINSNSIYRTLGEIMEIEVHHFSSCIELGIKHSLLDKLSLDKLSHHSKT